MQADLVRYYEKELAFLRQMSVGFAQQYPKIAGRLLLEQGESKDPYVERLIEAFAFLAARIHLKIDDDFPEITESFLQILYPHYLCPVPSMSIVQFTLDPQQGKLSTGYSIPRHRRLFSRPGPDGRCEFRTCYPVTLWPIEIGAVRMEEVMGAAGAVPALTLTLRAPRDAPFSQLEIDRLCFHLAGESSLAHRLYETLFGHCVNVELRAQGVAPVSLGRSTLAEVGFEKNEGMLPYSSRSFLGYRLLQEYFHFPEKFLFFEVRGLSSLRTAGFEGEVNLVFVLDQPARIDQKLEPAAFSAGLHAGRQSAHADGGADSTRPLARGVSGRARPEPRPGDGSVLGRPRVQPGARGEDGRRLRAVLLVQALVRAP